MVRVIRRSINASVSTGERLSKLVRVEMQRQKLDKLSESDFLVLMMNLWEEKGPSA